MDERSSEESDETVKKDDEQTISIDEGLLFDTGDR